MVQIVISELLSQKNKTKYWFIKEMNGSYQSLSKLIDNTSSAITFETLEKACRVLDCEPGDFMKIKK